MKKNLQLASLFAGGIIVGWCLSGVRPFRGVKEEVIKPWVEDIPGGQRIHVPFRADIDKPYTATSPERKPIDKATIRVASGPIPIFINDDALFSITFEKPIVVTDGYTKTVIAATVKNESMTKIKDLKLGSLVEAPDGFGNTITLYCTTETSVSFYPQEKRRFVWDGNKPVAGSTVIYRFDLGNWYGEMLWGWPVNGEERKNRPE